MSCRFDTNVFTSIERRDFPWMLRILTNSQALESKNEATNNMARHILKAIAAFLDVDDEFDAFNILEHFSYDMENYPILPWYRHDFKIDIPCQG